MQTILSLMPLIMVTLFLIFCSVLIIDDARRKNKEAAQKKENTLSDQNESSHSRSA